ncbi:23S rRNA (adenine(2503)-C(2))-methyltransferase RlmN [Roseiconus lacunae]|uniref:23S rRNA (adenine(2503)-C(2))-methyltransferase RlmN n=1 Tax=Roseiconus lacunae TaxID=2605694 RepID=UPI001E514E14|nr:23S rRNA (adenine(2503)-C(2))-methyltransferase RlmN [Roseiconus lacunae]MCD0460728.1 23S rRNA (adenine(2503)-C(2))-methyltransferase RlmN [Roseiconus lacunae]WRQ51338.1 23S rRNA (adenine(2503)-C(2))-methyltransferase RlmN [Stieleria sp. HD01]
MNLPVLQSDSRLPDAAASDDRQHLLDLSLEQLQGWLAEKKQPKFRAKQIFHWLYQKRARSFDEMSDLPKKLRHQLEESFVVFQASEAAVQSSRDGTDKLLVRLPDGGEVECVLLRDGHRRSICVSSQVGCAMGCVFCASGLDGVDRNLTRGEIVEQMLRLQARLDDGERLSHIVMMGMGEPLANLDRVLGALETARSADGLGISPRRITISTVGLPPAIDRLANSGVPYNLAVSLHAPNEELRSQLVPVNKKIGIDAVLEAADRYFDANGRRLTFEYVLLGGVNDDIDHARQLARRLRNRNVMLNVIPYNAVEGLPYETPSKQSISQFRETLESAGVNVMFRQRKGDEIDAACGQLRRNRGGKQ